MRDVDVDANVDVNVDVDVNVGKGRMRLRPPLFIDAPRTSTMRLLNLYPEELT